MVASPDGYVRPFDAGANGTVFGDAAAAVVLKRLDDAQRDGEPPYHPVAALDSYVLKPPHQFEKTPPSGAVKPGAGLWWRLFKRMVAWRRMVVVPFRIDGGGLVVKSPDIS